MTTTVGLAIGFCAATGVALALGLAVARRRRELATADVAMALLNRRLTKSEQDLAALREEVGELGPALIDAQRRWGFRLTRWPHVTELVGSPSSSSVSWWLLRHAPGIDALRDSGSATERFYVPKENGWRPPKALVP